MVIRLIKREVATRDLEQMPMTRFLFSFIKKTSKCNQEDEFFFKDWLYMLTIMKKTVAVNPRVKKMEFEPPPDAETHEYISLKEVLVTMLTVSYQQEKVANQPNNNEDTRNA